MKLIVQKLRDAGASKDLIMFIFIFAMFFATILAGKLLPIDFDSLKESLLFAGSALIVWFLYVRAFVTAVNESK